MKLNLNHTFTDVDILADLDQARYFLALLVHHIGNDGHSLGSQDSQRLVFLTLKYLVPLVDPPVLESLGLKYSTQDSNVHPSTPQGKLKNTDSAHLLVDTIIQMLHDFKGEYIFDRGTT